MSNKPKSEVLKKMQKNVLVKGIFFVCDMLNMWGIVEHTL